MAGPATIRSLPLPTALVNPRAIRSYILRLPLFTRGVILLVLLFWVLELQTVWSVIEWGSLKPSRVGLFTGGMYRLNTFVFVHLSFWHMLINVLILVPLLERFEREFGTLTSVALFLGPLATIPAGLYLVLEGMVFRGDTAVVGASMWVFMLLAAESIKTYKANPYLEIASYKIPTWTTPLVLAVVTSILLSNSSFLGHLCGLAIGYLWGVGYIRFLAPPERVLRWIESKLNLLGRLPHYVSVDQKTFGRYGVLPTTSGEGPAAHNPVGLGWIGTQGAGERLGP